jgi:hypothetical protein
VCTGRASICAQSPTVPSIRSRSRSAWPLWRAYSSIMWIMIQRSENSFPPVGTGDIQRRGRSGPLLRTGAFGPPGLECLRRIGAVDVVEVGVRVVVGVVVPRDLLTAQHHLEPLLLPLRHVPDQAQQRQLGRRYRPLPQRAAGQPVTFERQGVPVENAGTYIKPMLVQAAWNAIRVRGRLQARYNRLVRRCGGDKNPGAKKKAITAIAHTLLKIAYQVLKSGTPYQDLGADFYTRRESPEQKQAWLERQLQKLHPGRTITITISPPQAALAPGA